MNDATPTVFVVDKDVAILEMVRRLLTSVQLPVETCTTTEEFAERHDPRRPGCLILEVRMPGMGGMDLFRQLRREDNRIPVIFLTEHGDVATAVQAMREGAFYFLQKPVREQHLLDQVQQAIALDLRERREEAERQAVRAQLDHLSAREWEVLTEIFAGRTNREIAQQFGLAVKTVEFHRANVMKKVGVDSVVELVRLLLKIGRDRPMPRNPGSR